MTKSSRKIPRPLTGTEHRMKTLPHVNISSIENHQMNSEQPFVKTSEETKKEKMEELSSENLNRKCVFTYEDKYGFSRILTNDSLVFDSHFESGNLHSAFRVVNPDPNKHVYDLYLHTDLNTIGHTQWFYFSVANVKQGQDVTFVIRNFSKSDSLFNDGMRPLVHSMKSKRGWERCGTNISYFGSSSCASPLKSDGEGFDGDSKRKSSNYILCFSHVFEFSGDICYFSYCFPYTYTDLQYYLHSIISHPLKSKYCRRNILCKTVAGNPCDLLTITAKAKTIEELNRRVTVLLTARVHPGESNASWIMQGMIDALVSESDEAKLLRESFIFKIVPMLNPDGVINGNYRTSLSGCDLNRRWSNPEKTFHPTIYYCKELIRRLTKLRGVGLMLDIHGHSQRQGIFIYGCVPDKRLLRLPSQVYTDNLDGSVVTDNMKIQSAASQCPPKTAFTKRDIIAWRVKLLPRIFDNSINDFSFDSCSFKMQKNKSHTMRIVAFTELGVDCVYTVEASLAGREPNHFTALDLLQFGNGLSTGILAAYPSMAPPSSPYFQQYMLKQYTSEFTSILKSYNIILPTLNLDAAQIFRKFANLEMFHDEMIAWRRFYDPSTNFGKLLLSELGMSELYGDSRAYEETKLNVDDTSLDGSDPEPDTLAVSERKSKRSTKIKLSETNDAGATQDNSSRSSKPPLGHHKHKRRSKRVEKHKSKSSSNCNYKLDVTEELSEQQFNITTEKVTIKCNNPINSNSVTIEKKNINTYQSDSEFVSPSSIVTKRKTKISSTHTDGTTVRTIRNKSLTLQVDSSTQKPSEKVTSSEFSHPQFRLSSGDIAGIDAALSGTNNSLNRKSSISSNSSSYSQINPFRNMHENKSEKLVLSGSLGMKTVVSYSKNEIKVQDSCGLIVESKRIISSIPHRATLTNNGIQIFSKPPRTKSFISSDVGHLIANDESRTEGRKSINDITFQKHVVDVNGKISIHGSIVIPNSNS